MRQDTSASRRELLAGLAVAGSVGLAGCSVFESDDEETPNPVITSGPTRQPTREEPRRDAEEAEVEPPASLPFADEYGTLVDVVEAGADPAGEETIEPVLQSVADDDTLLYFPEGTYRMGGAIDFPTFRNLALVGGPATIVPESGYEGYLLLLGWDGGGRRARVENLTFDLRAPDAGARPLQVLANDLQVRDVSVVGRQNRGRGMMRFDVTDPDGTGVVERMALPDGAAVETGTVGCLVGPASTGHITFRDCHVEGFPNNGLYASPAKGSVLVEGGYYANNGIANVRVSGDAVVRGVHVRCDDSSRRLNNMRGIRLRHGRSILVEDCTVELVDVTYSEGAIILESLLESATVRDTTVLVDVDDVYALHVKSPARGNPEEGADPADRNVVFEGVSIAGSAANRSTVRVVDRDDCRFDRLCLHQTGPNRNGLHLVRSPGNVLSHALIDVTGEAFVLEQSPLEKINVTVADSTGDAGADAAGESSGCGEVTGRAAKRRLGGVGHEFRVDQ